MAPTRKIRTPIMHRVVEAAGLIFVGGTVADDKALDAAGQARQVLDKIGSYLEAAGSGKSMVLMANVYLANLSDKEKVNSVWTDYFGDDLPARATVGVAELAPGTLIEVTATAAKA